MIFAFICSDVIFSFNFSENLSFICSWSKKKLAVCFWRKSVAVQTPPVGWFTVEQMDFSMSLCSREQSWNLFWQTPASSWGSCETPSLQQRSPVRKSNLWQKWTLLFLCVLFIWLIKTFKWKNFILFMIVSSKCYNNIVFVLPIFQKKIYKVTFDLMEKMKFLDLTKPNYTKVFCLKMSKLSQHLTWCVWFWAWFI